ncbi:MAG: hypothetical protein ACLFUJ_07265 [Phycisphaerae bacterium]
MSEPVDIKPSLIGDVKRLVHFRDLIHHAGTLLYRRSMRYTILSVGISVVGLAGRAVGLGGLTVKQAIALPLLVGLTAISLGLALRIIPALISSRQINIAQANDLNLMEDHRKSLQDTHLEILWRRVFQYEWPFREADPTRQPTQRDRDEFMRLAGYALAHPLPQARQRCQIGLDLRYLEDWRDGAWFDVSDTKLREQFAGDIVLARISQMVPSTASRALKTLPARAAQKFWFALATRAVAVETAVGVWTLNGRYQTDLFNSQLLLWPGEEDQPWLQEFPDARELVLQRRAILLRRVFGPGPASSRTMIRRMFAQDLRNALWLRCSFDWQYVLGRLQLNLPADLAEAGLSQRQIDRHGRWARTCRDAIENFKAYCLQHHPELHQPERVEALRAARIVLHTQPKLVSRLAAAGLPGRQQALGRKLSQAACEGLGSTASYSRMLSCLRLHHELTRMQILGYETLIQNLRESLQS